MRPKHLILPICCLLIMGAVPAFADTNTSGQLIKGSRDTVYYLGADGKRYLFPTRQTFESWYPNFADVRKVPDDELHAYPLGGNVTYRPGVKMVKATTSPHVYAVDAGGVLRWIKSETVASEIYGSDWKTRIDDLPDTFFANYGLGKPIDSADDYRPADVASRNAAIDKGRGAGGGKAEKGPTVPPEETGATEVAGPGQPVTGPVRGGTAQPPATTETGETTQAPSTTETGETTQPPASTETGETTQPTTTETGETPTPPTTETGETTQPPATTETGEAPPPPESAPTKEGPHTQTISGVAVTQITSSSATIVWQTETPATSFVDYGSAANAYTTTAGKEKPRVKDHSVTLNGLEPSTIYHYRARSNHGSDDDVMSADAAFMTLAP